MGKNDEELESHLLVALAGRWSEGGSSTATSGGRRRGIGGEDAPAVEGGRGVAGELRESEVELKAGSARAERPWRSGATVSSSSPAFGWGGELARERGNWNAGILLVLKRTREGETWALPQACHGGS